MEGDGKLEHSEVDFVRRVILMAGGNPDDEDLFDEYSRADLDMAKWIRFDSLEPASHRLQ
jgi:hypothetical protein